MKKDTMSVLIQLARSKTHVRRLQRQSAGRPAPLVDVGYVGTTLQRGLIDEVVGVGDRCGRVDRK